MKKITKKRFSRLYVFLIHLLFLPAPSYLFCATYPRQKVRLLCETNIYHTSIAFYTIIGSEPYLPENERIHGHTWEWQLNNSPNEYHVTFAANGKIIVPGFDAAILTDSKGYSPDKNLCERTSNSMIHFTQNFDHYKWFYRGTADTLIVLDNLLNITEELEKKYDPMKEVAMAYAEFEYYTKMYPQGGAGYLFSNFAVNLFVKNLNFYREKCAKSADDLAFRDLFDHLNISVGQWNTNRFAVKWPESKEIHSKCPEYYQLYRNARKHYPVQVSKLASIHMHKVPMPLINSSYFQTNGSLGYYWPTAARCFFCNL